MERTATIPRLRWAVLVLIALVELIWLSIRITAPGVGLLSYTKGFPSIFITSLMAAALLGWSKGRERIRKFFSSLELPQRSWSLVLPHVIAFAAFSWMTVLIFEGNVRSSAWVLAWVGSALAAGVSWLIAAMPVGQWLRLMRQGSFALLAGIISITGASWILGIVAERAWDPLLAPTFSVVEWLLRNLGEEVVSDPTRFVLGTRDFSVGIYYGCTGYNGIGLVVAFLGVYFWVFRRSLRFPRVFLLLPCGILAIWLVNALRIVLLVIFGTHVSPQMAVMGFHSNVGWIGFIVVALALVAVMQRVSIFAVTRSETIAERRANPTTAYLAPLTVLLAAMMITGLFSSGFDWLYPVRVIATGGAIWFCWGRKDVTERKGTPHPHPLPQGAGEFFRNMRCNRLMDYWSWNAVVTGSIVFVIWMGFEGITGARGSSSIPGALKAMPAGLSFAWILFRVVGSVATAPIAEELAFRGFLLRRLISVNFNQLPFRFTWISFLVSSLLFGALHGRWLSGTAAGMCYALAAYRRGRLGDAVIAHATTNALIAANVLIMGKWHLW